jgi:uncharacterized SAM-binding protein YcdF (DUF218 family)
VLLLAFVLVTARLFVWPQTDTPHSSDAVVVLGPGLHGERLAGGLRLMRQGAGRVLVISRAQNRDWTAANQLCAEQTRFRVVCFIAKPFTTRGEAETIARLAEKHGWRSLIIVTSTYHVSRARLWNSRCHHGGVEVVGESPHAGLWDWAKMIVHEWGGLIDARVFATKC